VGFSNCKIGVWGAAAPGAFSDCEIGVGHSCTRWGFQTVKFVIFVWDTAAPGGVFKL
jgi:hypothetical protein